MKAEFYTEKNENNNISLRIEGDLTVKSGIEFKTTALEVLDQAGTGQVEVSLRNIKAIDVSAIQVLCAMKASLSKTKKTLTVLWPEDDGIDGLVTRTGFKQLLNF